MGKPFYQIMIEGIVVGQLLIWVYYITKMLILPNLTLLIDLTKSEAATLFIAGFLFHIICEITGVNIWYVNNYYKLLEKAKTQV